MGGNCCSCCNENSYDDHHSDISSHDYSRILHHDANAQQFDSKTSIDQYFSKGLVSATNSGLAISAQRQMKISRTSTSIS